MESEKGKRISCEQREMMLEFMLQHPSLATGKYSAPDGPKHKARFLRELASLLNSSPTGVTKSGDKWMKSWQDWRSDVKAKAAALKGEMKKTGGGSISSKTKPLTRLEERLLAFLGCNVVSGHENVLDVLAEDLQDLHQDLQDDPLGSSDTLFMPLEDHLKSNNVMPNHHDDPEQVALASPCNSEVVSCPSSASKMKRRLSFSSTEEEEKLLAISEKQVAISQQQLELKKLKLELMKEKLALDTRQIVAAEKASLAFVTAMQELTKCLDRK